MELFFQAAALVLLGMIFVLILRGTGRGIGELLSILVCCLVIVAALRYIRPLMEFVQTVRAIGALDTELLAIVFKAVGISVTAEIAALLCADAGNSAMGKALQFMATAAIGWLSLPLLTAILELIEEILRGL